MTADSRSDEARRLVWLARLIALAALLLIAATWPLWTPRHVFPEVPLFAWLRNAPDWAAWFFLTALLTALVVVLGFALNRAGRIACLGFTVALIALVCLDQHRLQPWAYQFALIGVVLSTAISGWVDQTVWGRLSSLPFTVWGRLSSLPFMEDRPCSQGRLESLPHTGGGICNLTAHKPQATAVHHSTEPLTRHKGSDDAALFWLRVLVIGLYVHSAFSKLDHSFFMTHGPQLLGAVLQAAGLKMNLIPATLRPWLAAAIPIGELLTAVLLCVRRSWIAGLIGAITMHVLLLIALGPWGLNHQPGVLIWNAYFIAQDVILFGGRSARLGGSRLNGASWVAAGVVGAATVLPLLEPFGWFDHWPAWALYASRPERVLVFVPQSEQRRLPPTAQRHLADINPLDDWLQLRLDRWSLAVLHAPIYPQDRFQIGVALAVAQRSGLTDIRVILAGPANRWTGKRRVREIQGVDELRKIAERFWLNALPSKQLNR